MGLLSTWSSWSESSNSWSECSGATAGSCSRWSLFNALEDILWRTEKRVLCFVRTCCFYINTWRSNWIWIRSLASWFIALHNEKSIATSRCLLHPVCLGQHWKADSAGGFPKTDTLRPSFRGIKQSTRCHIVGTAVFRGAEQHRTAARCAMVQLGQCKRQCQLRD